GNLSPYVAQVLPRHLYDGTDIQSNRFNNKPVGTGPFVFKEWVKGSHVRLEKNPQYWRDNEPYLDGVILKFIPDAGARSVAFRSGEVQLGYSNAIPLNEVKRYRESSEFDISTAGSQYTSAMFLHVLSTRRPPFNNPLVRKATLHAINREALLKIVWYS